MKAFKEIKANLKTKSLCLPTLRVALLGDTATQFLAIAIKGLGIDYGYNFDLFEAEYNQVERQIEDLTSDLYEFKAKYIILFQSTYKFGELYSLSTVEQQGVLADKRLQFVKETCYKNRDSKIIYYNYPEIGDTVFGSYANKIISSFTYQTRKFNYELMRLSQDVPNLFICDIAELQNKYGRNFMFAPNIYIGTEMIFSVDAIPYVAARTLDVIAATEGKIKKCLILDLDNTLWGGTIGDDGLEGIQLGHGLGIGKAFTELQMWVKKLKNRGIVICVCSKNNESIAKEAFEKHPDMILRLDDIAVFIANWETKVDNIRSIQQILNIGFDSMVFLDDNPFERNIVRENISDITVPELPEDPAEYLEYLYSLNLFETGSYSNEDKDRTKQYQEQAERAILSKSFVDEAEFLKSLDMTSEVSGFTKFNIPRVAQLSQRSNQFNLRTIRYTESDIEAMAHANDCLGITFTLKDKFGDNGLICVVIMNAIDSETCFIDTWFMSCRVLKRGMESFTLNTIVSFARQKGFKKIIGEYIPTAKNKMVEEHYTNLGFNVEASAKRNLYSLIVDTYKDKKCFIHGIIKQ
ncbi:HAD-IIIC family phosphatase [uncultured Bacteroides sp.]|uniref:HAD-IIIC family phosphatase n=1 Tax=uncultured Bacteroides sp. TaxID=162156 RepID=UPI002AA762DD|nr:HAD-IIIC family phosphatase [uncultured Bacteroides sp.]